VHDERLPRPAAHRHAQSCEDERGVEEFAHGPAYDATE
jgi:hypothetical protein